MLPRCLAEIQKTAQQLSSAENSKKRYSEIAFADHMLCFPPHCFPQVGFRGAFAADAKQAGIETRVRSVDFSLLELTAKVEKRRNKGRKNKGACFRGLSGEKQHAPLLLEN